jgi:hypothetical protein
MHDLVGLKENNSQEEHIKDVQETGPIGALNY